VSRREYKILTSLDISAISHIVRADVASGDILDGFEDIVVLTDATNGNSEASVEVTVFDQDVGTVGFHGNRVISVGHIPTTESDVVCIDYVRAVGIERTEFKPYRLVASAVYIYIFEKNVLTVDHGHSPHLGVDESGTQKVAVFRSSDGDLMRSARTRPEST
jgi:hypothetical protein